MAERIEEIMSQASDIGETAARYGHGFAACGPIGGEGSLNLADLSRLGKQRE